MIDDYDDEDEDDGCLWVFTESVELTQPEYFQVWAAD